MTNVLTAQVCIVGAGPVGGVLACSLARNGVSVALVDQAPLPPMEHPAFDGRAYAIAARSRALLESAGLWDALDVPPHPIRDIRVTDGRPGRAASRLHLHFDHRDAGEDVEAFGWMVEARSLRKALNKRFAEQPGLTLFAPATARVTRDPDGARVCLDNGAEIDCRLVIAAEGRNSKLREQAGIPVTRVPYGQSAIVCAIAHERPHGDVALEHFLPAGPFAVLPMGPSGDVQAFGGQNLSAIVWTERTGAVDRITTLGAERFQLELQRRLGAYLGDIRVVGRRWTYPLSAMIAHRYTDMRLALAGDAAHGIHPIAGQGLNLGIRDAIALSDLVPGAADAGSPDVLARYEALRKADNISMLAMTDGLDRLFSTDNRVVRSVRRIGIGSVNRIKPAMRAFMRQGMGLGAAQG
jgi:2-octaprenyl-6-methoxyphenol hydroxylase